MPIGHPEHTREGHPRRRQPKHTREERGVIIEELRGMIRVGMTDGEMKRAVGKKHSLKGRSVEKYITAARNRNREYLGVSEDENLAASLAYWNRKKQESEQALQAARKGMADTEKLLADAGERKDVELYEAAASRLADLRKQVYTAEMHSRDAQDHVDKLLGNHAPIKTDARNVNVNADMGKESLEQLHERMARIGMKPLSIEVESLPEAKSESREG